jgi:DNA-binding response OmpR family regulator
MHRILIIDDDHHILLMIKKMLERAGFEVDLASNGDEGLKIFKKLSFDLVITDIIMPEKEGLETIREMKRLRSDLKIIAMSGGGKVSSDNYLNTAKIFGATKIMTKPFTQNQMVSAVRELLGELSKGNPFNGNGLSEDGLEQEKGS